MRGRIGTRIVLALLAAIAVIASACNTQGTGGNGLSGTIRIDGSSTVFPVTEAVAEEFQSENPGVRVTVGISGTGGGFKKFCAGETDASDASRPIKDEEAEECADNGIEYVEMAVAIDALAVLVNRSNDWIANDCITVEQLKTMWDEGSTVRRWSDVDPSWPDREVKFYAPGHDSGTFDYFTEAVNGESQRSRTDNVLFSEDDNVLVQGVEGDGGSIGYFGVAYYNENQDSLKALAVDGGGGCKQPTLGSIQADEYKPLGRPIYVYAKLSSFERPEVRAFFEYYLEVVEELVADVGYYPLPDADLEASRSALDEALGG